MCPRLPRQLLLVLAIVALAACSSGAGSSSATAPLITEPWARPAAAGGQSAAYFTITNTSDTADALLSASTPVAGMVQVHETTIDGSGVAEMRQVPRVNIPAGEAVVFKPGSYHVMMMGLTQDLVVGGTVELELVFEHAGRVSVKAAVRQA